MAFGEQTYYELLEISPRATREEIQVAYNRSRAAFSQNSLAVYSLFSPEECQAMLRRIEEAYRTLMNEEARRRYDESIGLAPARPGPRPAPVPAPRPAA
ncbi:MAG TPA: molecular chaperone DnaJ, partial [Thermodesulfobacteriota bacterium]|nr:molecular chaperone DnaJ [Thermodesulfobacteriota bacterium]